MRLGPRKSNSALIPGDRLGGHAPPVPNGVVQAVELVTPSPGITMGDRRQTQQVVASDLAQGHGAGLEADKVLVGDQDKGAEPQELEQLA